MPPRSTSGPRAHARAAGDGRYDPPVRIAAIDVGSNSVHMVVVDAVPGRDLRIVAREKEMVRLGDSAFADGHLSASAQARALSTITRFSELARRLEAEAVLAAATSAVREAANGKAFLALVRKETGLHVGLLSGQEEARLIYLAVRDAMDLRGAPSLIIDVGGGSTELIVGDATGMRWAESLPLGVLRLNARFEGGRALGKRKRRALREHVRGVLEEGVRRGRGARVGRAVGTAGTVNAIVRLLLAREGFLVEPDSPSVQRIPADAIHELAEDLLAMPMAERLELPGLDPARADTLGLGAIVVDEVLAGLGVGEIRTCRAAVREGMVLDYVLTHPEGPSRRATGDVRERSVRDAVARYGDTTAHGEQVSRLALSLFDATRRLHGLAAADREILHFASLLHDVGHHVEHRRHHRHSWYLVKNAELQGFDPEEIEAMAVLCRYHRRGAPKDDHEEWKTVPPRRRDALRTLIGLLRVADGLDRGHAATVDAVTVTVRRDVVRLRVVGHDAVELDVWGARNKVDVLEECLGRRVEIEGEGRAPRRRRVGGR